MKPFYLLGKGIQGSLNFVVKSAPVVKDTVVSVAKAFNQGRNDAHNDELHYTVEDGITIINPDKEKDNA